MELSNLLVRLKERTKSTDENQRCADDESWNSCKPSDVNLGAKLATEQRPINGLELPEIKRGAEK